MGKALYFRQVKMFYRLSRKLLNTGMIVIRFFSATTQRYTHAHQFNENDGHGSSIRLKYCEKLFNLGQTMRPLYFGLNILQ